MRRYFYLVVKDPILYQKAAMSLFEIEGPFRECDRYTKSKYKLAAVAAQWEELTEAECHRQCRMCQISNKYHCLGAMEGELYNMRQIYGLEVSLY